MPDAAAAPDRALPGRTHHRRAKACSSARRASWPPPTSRVLITRGDRVYARASDGTPLSDTGRPRPTTSACSATPRRCAIRSPAPSSATRRSTWARPRWCAAKAAKPSPRPAATARSTPVPATLDIVSARSEMRVGDRLLPEPAAPAGQLRAARARAAGRRRPSCPCTATPSALAGQNQVVVINKGTADGIGSRPRAGHPAQPAPRIVDRSQPGERTEIKLPNERNGLLMVFRPFERLSYALILETHRGRADRRPRRQPALTPYRRAMERDELAALAAPGADAGRRPHRRPPPARGVRPAATPLRPAAGRRWRPVSAPAQAQAVAPRAGRLARAARGHLALAAVRARAHARVLTLADPGLSASAAADRRSAAAAVRQRPARLRSGRAPSPWSAAATRRRRAGSTRRQFARAFAEAGLTVVSGLALGVDAAAHEGALEGAAPGQLATIAVVGTGLDRVYPEPAPANWRTASPRTACCCPSTRSGTAPLAENFPRRNRIIAGLGAGHAGGRGRRCNRAR